jgi:polyhydroxyalkanoate synthase
MQGSLQEGWTKALEQFQNFDAAELGLPAGQGAVPNIRFEPRQLQQVHQGYLKEAAELWNQSLQSSLSLADRRFNGEAWERNPMASFAAAAYLLNARTLMSLAEAAEADAKTKARMRFAVEQWVAASAPSNFLAFNAEAQKKAVETKGESCQGRAEPAGRHAPGPCVDDRREPVRGGQERGHHRRRGGVRERAVPAHRIQAADRQGARAAFPAGAAVHQQVLHPRPAARQLLHPLRRQPGHRTFVVSWRNPDASMDKTWDDYIEQAAIKAIATVQDITGAKQINALGFCVGGTILTTALAVLAARGEKPVAAPPC